MRRTRDVVHCWRSKDELMSNVLVGTPTHGHTSVGRPAKTSVLCEHRMQPRPTSNDRWYERERERKIIWERERERERERELGTCTLSVWLDDGDDDDGNIKAFANEIGPKTSLAEKFIWWRHIYCWWLFVHEMQALQPRCFVFFFNPGKDYVEK